VDFEAQDGRGDAWPPPHPTPPPAPPREYGSPGREPDLRWLWAALGGALAIALFAGGGIFLLSASPADEPAVTVTPSPAAPAPSSEPAPPTSSPVAETSAPPAAQARCWDASTAPTVEECSMPDGPAGLAWVFPQLPGQQCKPPTSVGNGVVVRVLCQATLPDGSAVRLGYFQWESVDAAVAYYDGQGLGRNDVGSFHGWTARLGNRTKKAVVYGEAPYSRTLMFQTASADSPELQHLDPRPPDQLRGEPTG
jgi:hypothetical protein